VREAAVDHVVVGGDVVVGPMTRETLQCLLDLPFPVQFFYGNGEVAGLPRAAAISGGIAGRVYSRVDLNRERYVNQDG
jgi:hypothetical protein